MHKRFHIYIITFILLTLFILSLFQNYHNTEINEYAYVMAIGLDVGTNHPLKLTLQIANPSVTAANVASQGGSSDDNSVSIIDTVECSSISSGLTWFNSYLSKEVNLSHCKALVFSEKLASLGISEYIYTLMNNLQFRKSANIIVAQTTSEAFLKNYKPALEKLSANYYENIPTTSKYTGYTQNITVSDFFNDYLDTFQNPIAILGSVDNQENIGIALFDKDKFIGKLGISDTICHMLVSKKLVNTRLYIPNVFDDDKSMDFYIDKVKKSTIKVDIVNGTPLIKLDLDIEGELLSMQSNVDILDKATVKNIENYINRYMKYSLLNYLYKTCKEYKTDIDGFGKYAVKYFSNWQDWENYNWLEQYSSSFFDVNVNFNLRSSQLILKT